jgi:hypothetical protein
MGWRSRVAITEKLLMLNDYAYSIEMGDRDFHDPLQKKTGASRLPFSSAVNGIQFLYLI